MSDDNSGAVLRRGSDAQVHQQKSADICPKSRDVSQSAAASQKSGGIRSDEGKEVGAEGASLKEVTYPPAWRQNTGIQEREVDLNKWKEKREGSNDGKGRGVSRSGVGGNNDDAAVTDARKLSRTRHGVASAIDDLVEVGEGGGGCHALGGVHGEVDASSSIFSQTWYYV
jgi:hypothetical protein